MFKVENFDFVDKYFKKNLNIGNFKNGLSFLTIS